MSLYKLKGQRGKIPPSPPYRTILIAWMGSFLFISLLTLAEDPYLSVFILGSFGASSVLVFGYPEAPFSQPRNVLFGHVLSAIIALFLFDMLGFYWWSLSLAVSTSIVVMMSLRTVHPPAGSNPIIVFFTAPSWDFILFPILSGAVMLVIFALIYNNIFHKKEYPLYW